MQVDFSGVRIDDATDHIGFCSLSNRAKHSRFDTAAQMLILVEHLFQFVGARQHKDDSPLLVLRKGFQSVDDSFALWGVCIASNILRFVKVQFLLAFNSKCSFSRSAKMVASVMRPRTINHI